KVDCLVGETFGESGALIEIGSSSKIIVDSSIVDLSLDSSFNINWSSLIIS
ncbi:25137_t:CDS:1, partial [Dentiscutata erythropus]